MFTKFKYYDNEKNRRKNWDGINTSIVPAVKLMIYSTVEAFWAEHLNFRKKRTNFWELHPPHSRHAPSLSVPAYRVGWRANQRLSLRATAAQQNTTYAHAPPQTYENRLLTHLNENADSESLQNTLIKKIGNPIKQVRPPLSFSALRTKRKISCWSLTIDKKHWRCKWPFYTTCQTDNWEADCAGS